MLFFALPIYEQGELVFWQYYELNEDAKKGLCDFLNKEPEPIPVTESISQ
jgi:hypothetical protein